MLRGRGRTDSTYRSLLSPILKKIVNFFCCNSFATVELGDALLHARDLLFREVGLGSKLLFDLSAKGYANEVIFCAAGAVGGLLIGLIEALASSYLGGEYKLLATFIVLVIVLIIVRLLKGQSL